MAPAAPSLVGAMMGLGVGVAAFHPLLFSSFPEVSLSLLWAWREAEKPCGLGPVIFWLGREVLLR